MKNLKIIFLLIIIFGKTKSHKPTMPNENYDTPLENVKIANREMLNNQKAIKTLEDIANYTNIYELQKGLLHLKNEYKKFGHSLESYINLYETLGIASHSVPGLEGMENILTEQYQRAKILKTIDIPQKLKILDDELKKSCVTPLAPYLAREKIFLKHPPMV